MCPLTQAHSCIHFFGHPRKSITPLRRIGKDVGLDMDGRFSSCRDRGHIGTIILASCPSLKSHAAVHSASWWPQRKSWDPADLAQPFMGRVFGWPWCLKILSWRWWIFTLYRVLVTDMVCAPKALKGIDTLDPFPPPSHNVAMKMQSIQFLTFPSPALTRAPTVST